MGATRDGLAEFYTPDSTAQPHAETILRRVTIAPMLDWSECPAVEHNPDRVSGAWVFRGTRVPVTALFENLESGASLEEFLEWFPGVTREQAEGVLEHVARSLLVA